MRGGYATAARWNAHFIAQAEKHRDEAIAAVRARADEIHKTFSPLEADDQGFWSVWYEWQKGKSDINVPYNNCSYYSQGGSHTGAIFDEFVRTVRRQERDRG